MAPAGTVGVALAVLVDEVVGLVRVENVDEGIGVGLAVVVGRVAAEVVASVAELVAGADELDDDEDVVDVFNAEALYAAVAPTTLACPETALRSVHCPGTYVMAMQALIESQDAMQSWTLAVLERLIFAGIAVPE